MRFLLFLMLVLTIPGTPLASEKPRGLIDFSDIPTRGLPAHGVSVKGIFMRCEESRFRCMDHIGSILDTADAGHKRNPAFRMFCPPEGHEVKPDEVLSILSRFFEKTPEAGRLGLAHTAMALLAHRYPCPEVNS